jgi:hypothetical protein
VVVLWTSEPSDDKVRDQVLRVVYARLGWERAAPTPTPPA